MSYKLDKHTYGLFKALRKHRKLAEKRAINYEQNKTAKVLIYVLSGFMIGYLIFFATCVAYYLIPYGQKYIRPTLVSMYNYLSPVISAVVSIWLGMDHLTWQKVLAAVAIVGGVILVSRSRAAQN